MMNLSPFQWCARTGYMLLGLFSFVTAQVNDDVGIAEIQRPAFTECGDGILPEVRIQNFGTNELNSFFVNYELDGNLVANFLWSGNLAPGETHLIVFPQLNLSPGPYSLKVSTALPNGNTDNNIGNDAQARSFTLLEPNGQPIPFSEDFETATFPPADWLLSNPDNGLSWQQTGQASFAGSQAIYMNSYVYDSLGAVDELQLPGLDLTVFTRAQLSFQLAYAPYGANTGYADTLEVWVSGDCGVNFDLAYKKWGLDLATAPPSTSEFFPQDADHWRKVVIDLGPYASSTFFVAKFRFTNNYENNLYLDLVEVQRSFNTNLDEDELAESLKVFPQPARDQLQLSWPSLTAEAWDISLIDVLGQQVWMHRTGKVSGTRLLRIPLKEIPPGTYLLKLAGNKQQVYRKVQVY